MPPPRCSMRALRTLATSGLQVRSLHITGSANFASPLLTNHIDRPKQARIDAASDGSVRLFNSSRSLKAVGDSSTIDFAYLPALDADSGTPQPQVRVPLLPNYFYPTSTNTSYTADEEELVMRPEISLASADSTHVLTPSAFAEVHDNSNVDFQGMADKVAQNAKHTVDEQGSMVKQVWSGFLEDVFGDGNKPSSA